MANGDPWGIAIIALVVERGLGTRDSGLGTRDSGLGTRDSGLGTRDSGLGTRDQKRRLAAPFLTLELHRKLAASPAPASSGCSESRVPSPGLIP
ncbi:hypothetical protein [Xanthomonas translucens]|uniref:hypothetical protein n=1 Tax=Xanthomonas campestris pv. translucens TaxID=343 RepID=UPI001AFACA1F|nr:hypothetical protein [Xanthomonas translucens]QSQ55193.1 hypothetical protein ISN37_11885 [Xanthomonas translucens pv. undulosa]